MFDGGRGPKPSAESSFYGLHRGWQLRRWVAIVLVRGAQDRAERPPTVPRARGACRPVWSRISGVRWLEHSFRGPNDRQGNARSEAHDSPAACWICMQHAGCPASTLRERACAADSSRPERSRTRCAQKSNRLGLSLSMWWDQYLRSDTALSASTDAAARSIGRTLTAGTVIVAGEIKQLSGKRWIRIGHGWACTTDTVTGAVKLRAAGCSGQAREARSEIAPAMEVAARQYATCTHEGSCTPWGRRCEAQRQEQGCGA